MPPEPRVGLGGAKARRPHPASLRRRLKLVSAQSGRPLQALATDALERVCTQFDIMDTPLRAKAADATEASRRERDLALASLAPVDCHGWAGGGVRRS